MMLKGRYMIIVLLLSSSLSIIGQNNNPIDQIFTLEGDTINTSIRIINNRYSPAEIITTATGSTVLSPNDIKGFTYKGLTFISAPILREISPFKQSELSTTHELLYIEDTVFLQVIVSGERSLLQLHDSTGKVGYFIPDDVGGFEWLVHKKYYRSNQNGQELMEINNYIGQLLLYLNDCKGINKIVSSTEYDEESLVKLYDYYYGCTNNKIEFKQKSPGLRTEFTAVAGLSFTRLSFSGPGNEHITNPNFPWSINFIGGVGISLSVPNISSSWSFNNEVLFTSYRTSAEYRFDINSANYRITNTTIGTSAIKLNTMFRGHMSVNYAKVFIDIGLSNRFVMSTVNDKSEIVYSSGSSSENKGTAFQNIKKHNFGFMVGVGVKVKRVSGTLRYELGGKVGTQDDLESKINTLFLMLSYRILETK